MKNKNVCLAFGIFSVVMMVADAMAGLHGLAVMMGVCAAISGYEYLKEEE